MESEGSLPYSQGPSTNLNPWPEEYSPVSLRSILILSSHLHQGLPNGTSFSILEKGETESTWYVGHYLAYCISPRWRMSLEQLVEWLAGET
jgi:hypothetical protein